jgi:putative transposase
MARDLSGLGLRVIQIDGIHMDEDMTLVAAIGVDANGDKHPLGLVEGATENAATVQALALTFDGSALGRRGHAGSRQGV